MTSQSRKMMIYCCGSHLRPLPGDHPTAPAILGDPPTVPARMTRFGLVRGAASGSTSFASKMPKALKIAGKRKKFTARDLAEMNMSNFELKPLTGCSSGTGGDKGISGKDFKLRDEEEEDDVSHWSDDLELEDLPHSKKVRALELDAFGKGKPDDVV